MSDSIYSIKHFQLHWVSDTTEYKNKFVYDFTIYNEKESNNIKIFFKGKKAFEIDKISSCSQIVGFRYCVKKNNLHLFGKFPSGDIRFRVFYYSTKQSYFQHSVFYLLKEIIPLEALLFQRTMRFKIKIALLYQKEHHPRNLHLINPFVTPIKPQIDVCHNKETITRLTFELTDKSLKIGDIGKTKDLFFIMDTYKKVGYLPNVSFYIPTKQIKKEANILYSVYDQVLKDISKKININSFYKQREVENENRKTLFIFTNTKIPDKKSISTANSMFVLNSSLILDDRNPTMFYKLIKQLARLLAHRKLQGYKENKYSKIIVHLIYLYILKEFLGDIYIDYKRNKFVKKKILELSCFPLSMNKYERILSGFTESVYRNILSFYVHFIIDHCTNNQGSVETFINSFFEEHHSVSYCFEKACNSINLCFDTFKKNVKKNFFLPVNIIEYLNRYKNGTEIEMFNINKVQKILATPINLDYKDKTCEVIKHKSINMSGPNYKISLHKQIDFKKNKTKTEEGTHLDYLICGNYNNLNVNYNTFITNFTLILHNINSSHYIRNILFNLQNLEVNVNTNNNLLRILKTKQKKTENDSIVVKVNENCVVKSNKLSYKKLKFYENDVNYQCLRNYSVNLYQNNCPIFETNEELLLAKNKHAIKILEKRILDKKYYYKIKRDSLTVLCNLEFEKLGYKKELNEFRDDVIYNLLKDSFLNSANIVKKCWYEDVPVYNFHLLVLETVYSNKYNYIENEKFIRFILDLFKYHKTDDEFNDSKIKRVIIGMVFKIRKTKYTAEIRMAMKFFIKDYMLNIRGFYSTEMLVKVFADYIICLKKTNLLENEEEIKASICILSNGRINDDCFDILSLEYAYYKLSVMLIKKFVQMDVWYVTKARELFFKLNTFYKRKLMLKTLEFCEYIIKKLTYYNRNIKITQIKEKVEKLEGKLKAIEKFFEDLEYESNIEAVYFYRILIIIKHYFNKTTYFEWLSDLNRIIGIKSTKRIKKRIRKFWKTKDTITLENIDPIHFFLN